MCCFRFSLKIGSPNKGSYYVTGSPVVWWSVLRKMQAGGLLLSGLKTTTGFAGKYKL